jgi:hypothetical protein
LNPPDVAETEGTHKQIASFPYRSNCPNYKFITTFNPATVLELIEEIERLQVQGVNTAAECIDAVLRRGGRWRNKQIEIAILQSFGIQFQNNTIAKYLAKAMENGTVMSGPTGTRNGTYCSEYWMVAGENRERLERIRKIASTFPDGHTELGKIEKQIGYLLCSGR